MTWAIASAVAVDEAGRRATRRQEFSRELYRQALLCQSDSRQADPREYIRGHTQHRESHP